MENFVERTAKKHNIDIKNISIISDELSIFLLNNSDFYEEQLVKLLNILTKIKN